MQDTDRKIVELESMFDEDTEPRKPGGQPKNLEPMSIEELEAYISDLKQEIARAEAEIERKKSHRDAASSIFKN